MFPPLGSLPRVSSAADPMADADPVPEFYVGHNATADSDAPPAKKSKKGASGFDYASDKRYEKLVGVFNVASLKELSTLRIEDLRKKAVELTLLKQGVVKAQGFFRSYQNAIDAILELVEQPDVEVADGDERSGAGDEEHVVLQGEAVDDEEHENSEFDSKMQEMMQIIDRILSGDENDFENLNLSENRVEELVKLMTARCEDLETELRDTLADMNGEDRSVKELLDLGEVSHLTPAPDSCTLCSLSPTCAPTPDHIVLDC